MLWTLEGTVYPKSADVITLLMSCQKVKYACKVIVVQLCPTLCDPTDCVLPGSTVHVILQTILEWVAIPFPRGSSQPRDKTQVSCIAGRFCTIWVTREDHALNPEVIWQSEVALPSTISDNLSRTRQSLDLRNSEEEASILAKLHLCPGRKGGFRSGYKDLHTRHMVWR